MGLQKRKDVANGIEERSRDGWQDSFGLPIIDGRQGAGLSSILIGFDNFFKFQLSFRVMILLQHFLPFLIIFAHLNQQYSQPSMLYTSETAMHAPQTLITKPPASAAAKKPLLSRINECNRTLGIFFGCLGGMVLGLVLVTQHQISIAIIGVPSSLSLQVFTVLLAMGTGGNLCSYIGAFVDLITADRTIFDAILSFYSWCKKDSRRKKRKSHH